MPVELILPSSLRDMVMDEGSYKLIDVNVGRLK